MKLEEKKESFVERAATAHWEAKRSGFSIPRLGIYEIAEWEQLSPEFKAKEIAATRAAIEAMTEPTIDMIVAATEDWLCIRAQEDRAEAIWKAMIESALAEEPSNA